MKDYSKIFDEGDLVFVHFYDCFGREITTRDYGHPHEVYEENGMVGIYFYDTFEEKSVFKPFNAFAPSVKFERAL